MSYVINGKDNAVSEGTRQQVWAAIQRIGYTPNVTARSLQSRATKLIGYAWHRVQTGQMNAVLDHFTYYLAQAAEAAGYHILTFTHDDSNWEAVYTDLIRTRRVDGFVLSDTLPDDERIRFLLDQRFPFVSFGRANSDWEFAYVDTDGRQGVIDAVDYLLGLGHCRIAMVAWGEDSIAGGHRVEGYQDALERAHVVYRPEYVWRGTQHEQTGRDALAHLMALDEPPTAVVCVSDLIAIGVMNAAEAYGLSIGRDLSVIGFDDVPLGQYLRPALTTIKQPIIEIGATVVGMLQTLITGETPAPMQVLVTPELIVRESCGVVER